MARNYVALPYEYLEEMEELSDAEFGRLTRALLTFSMTGEPIALCGNERFYAKRVMNCEERFKESYETQAAAFSGRGKAGAAARWGSTKDTEECQGISSNAKNAQACLSIPSNAKNGNTETETESETESEAESNILLSGAGTPPAPPPSPAVIAILLNDKTEYAVTEADVAGWSELYPAVDVMRELRKMKGWADANPTKRKTRNGVKRFINNWLAKEQDRYHETGGGTVEPPDRKAELEGLKAYLARLKAE